MLDKLFEQNKELFTKSDYKIMEYLMRHKQDLQYLTTEDLVMMFSYSRILTEIQILLQHAGMVHYKTVLFTDLLVSPEIQQADVVLYSYRGEPSEYHSMAAPMVIVDLLIMNLMRERGDSVERAGYLEKLREKYAALIKR